MHSIEETNGLELKWRDAEKFMKRKRENEHLKQEQIFPTLSVSAREKKAHFEKNDPVEAILWQKSHQEVQTCRSSLKSFRSVSSQTFEPYDQGVDLLCSCSTDPCHKQFSYCPKMKVLHNCFFGRYMWSCPYLPNNFHSELCENKDNGFEASPHFLASQKICHSCCYSCLQHCIVDKPSVTKELQVEIRRKDNNNTHRFGTSKEVIPKEKRIVALHFNETQNKVCVLSPNTPQTESVVCTTEDNNCNSKGMSFHSDLQDSARNDIVLTMAQSSIPSEANKIVTFTNANNSVVYDEVLQYTGATAYDTALAHDVASFVFLDTWKGLTSQKITLKFEPPDYDFKQVAASLWKLRSGGKIEEVVQSIATMEWRDVEMSAFYSQIVMFVSALSYDAPFTFKPVIPKSKTKQEKNSCPRSTGLDIIAVRNIEKGEKIRGLDGQVLSLDKAENKDMLKTWSAKKLNVPGEWIWVGPSAYLKHSIKNSNTKAVFRGDVAVSIIASKNIESGQKIIVSCVDLVSSLKLRSRQSL